MTKEYLETILTEYGVAFTDSLADRLLKEFEPSNDMVSRGVFEQVMWERDVAIEQLKELGYELGEKVEPCDDAISREWLKIAIHNFYYGLKHTPTEEDIQAYIDAAPSVNSQPSGDLISRQSAIFLANDLKQDLPDDERIADMVMAHNEGVSEYQTQLSLLPAVTPQPKTGEWIGDAKTYYEELNKRGLGVDEYTPYFTDDIACSECLAKYSMLDNETQFFKCCPNCGARMVEPQERSSEE